ncbi:MAG: 50S ribosomal protein L11 methyltransferase, partial [Rhizobacter sp.]|nr:50S ribosomal protein L11 methyltransferase [Ferruginibacter sp.]
MHNYISVCFQSTPEQSEMITALLMSMGYEGAEEQDNETIISIKQEAFDETILKKITESFGVTYTLNTVAQQNWNAQWESSFEPVQVDDFALIRASFHAAKTGILHDIIITPKMSFGTGHHATTFLVIQQMSALNFKDKSVIDFGTGTGVLAILAEKMGAGSILAIDNDEWSINNSEENIAANGCDKIDIRLANEMIFEEKADIILANINLNVIIGNIQKIKDAVKNNGSVLLSGLLVVDEETIKEVL